MAEEGGVGSLRSIEACSLLLRERWRRVVELKRRDGIKRELGRVSQYDECQSCVGSSVLVFQQPIKFHCYHKRKGKTISQPSPMPPKGTLARWIDAGLCALRLLRVSIRPPP